MANPQTQPDEVLLRLARNDPDAYCAFYDRHTRPLHAWLTRETGDAQLALDLTAESFAQGLRSLHRFRGDREGAGRAWLYAIARHLLNRHRETGRREVQARQRLGIPLDTFDTVVDVEERVTRSGSATALSAALEHLPEEQRQAVGLRVLDELGYDEIAERLGCTVATARARVSRGLRALHVRLEGEIC